MRANARRDDFILRPVTLPGSPTARRLSTHSQAVSKRNAPPSGLRSPGGDRRFAPTRLVAAGMAALSKNTQCYEQTVRGLSASSSDETRAAG